jgi:tetratricopeptide (TPR) repeat protein
LIEINKIMNRIDKLKEFLQATPNDSFLQHALALEYIKEANDNEAKVLFEAILEREPNYVGSYYHLGKLLERNNNIVEAIDIYKKGMEQAKMAKDNHSYNELIGAREDLEDG